MDDNKIKNLNDMNFTIFRIQKKSLDTKHWEDKTHNSKKNQPTETDPDLYIY